MDVFTISTPGETDGGKEYPLPTVVRTPSDLLDLIRSSVDTKAELNEMGVVMFRADGRNGYAWLGGK